jgi:5-methylcytosine-specific restriction endonuclease McrA
VADDVALEALRAACADLRIPLSEALAEKAEEISCRAFLICIPNETLRPEQFPEYLQSIGRDPTSELLERIAQVRRGRPLSKEDIIALEQKQNLRCSLCGTMLDRAARPHVDHIVPVALHGGNEVSNLQLLCHQCNMGKGPLLSWVLGVPFQSRRESYRLRYCVLARAKGSCQASNCKNSSLNTELIVTTRIAEQRGGSPIFDNLEALCRQHYESRMAANRRRALNSLKLKQLSHLFFDL